MIETIVTGAIFIGLISVFGGFLVKHLTKTITEQFQYYLGLVKKDTYLSYDVISFNDNYIKKGVQLPIIPFKVEGRLCNLLLDSGANINLLDRSVFEEINNTNKIELIKGDQPILFGGGASEQVGIAKLNFSHKRTKFIEEFDIIDLSEAFGEFDKRCNLKIDGVVGTKFFKTNQWSLDFDKMVVWVK